MVDKPNIKDDLSILDVRTREKILRFLYDKKEVSAYKIADEIDMATATIIDHLNKLEENDLVLSKDATKGRLIRRYYSITKKGRETLLSFLKNYAEDIKTNRYLADNLKSFLK